MTSLPVPLSPVISTVASVAATRRASSSTSRVAGSSATIRSSSPHEAGSMCRTISASSTSGSNGFVM